VESQCQGKAGVHNAEEALIQDNEKWKQAYINTRILLFSLWNLAQWMKTMFFWPEFRYWI